MASVHSVTGTSQVYNNRCNTGQFLLLILEKYVKWQRCFQSICLVLLCKWGMIDGNRIYNREKGGYTQVIHYLRVSTIIHYKLTN